MAATIPALGPQNNPVNINAGTCHEIGKSIMSRVKLFLMMKVAEGIIPPTRIISRLASAELKRVKVRNGIILRYTLMINVSSLLGSV